MQVDGNVGKNQNQDSMLPLATVSCPINYDCIGERWEVQNDEHLAGLIAIIATGQILQARCILSELSPAKPVLADLDLRNEAKIKLTVQEKKQSPRIGYPYWQRDGFMFEAISWIAAFQVHGNTAYLKDPHLCATSQGLDGLMIELSSDKTEILRTTIFEDKCTENPVSTFKSRVIPAFESRHDNSRNAEIIAAATGLLGRAGIDDRTAAKLAAAVTDRSKRRYRAAFAVTSEFDSDAGRKKLFAGFDKIGDIDQSQRLGACLVVPPKLRVWFDKLAKQAVYKIDTLSFEGVDV